MKRLLRRLRGGLAVLLMSYSFATFADAADGIVGNWLVETRDAVIHFSRGADGSIEGRIAWQLHNRYDATDGPDWDGKIVVDRHNPDPALRSRPLDNMLMIWGLRFNPDDQEWSNGHVYSADDGHTYRCLIRLKDPDHLYLRGYFGITLLGGSTTWTRVDSVPPRLAEAQPHGRSGG
jgi:uncharacterized protein (DUF2147 family)